MNKQERKLKGLAKFKQRLINYKLVGVEGRFHAFKQSGKPCSCYVCSTHKYKHNGILKKEKKEFELAFI